MSANDRTDVGCKWCRSTGECSSCGGAGWVPVGGGWTDWSTLCSICSGDRGCRQCNGTGFMLQWEVDLWGKPEIPASEIGTTSPPAAKSVES